MSASKSSSAIDAYADPRLFRITSLTESPDRRGTDGQPPIVVIVATRASGVENV